MAQNVRQGTCREPRRDPVCVIRAFKDLSVTTVAIDSLNDMETVFEAIPLNEVSTSN